MDVDKIINDFQRKNDGLFVQKVEKFVEKLEKLRDKIIEYNSKYDLKVDTNKLKENVELYTYHCALYIKNYNQLSDVEQTSLFNDLKNTLNCYVEYYNSIAHTVNKIIDNRKKEEKYEEEIDEYGSKAVGYLTFGFVFTALGLILSFASMASKNSLMGLMISGVIILILGILCIFVGASNKHKVSEIERRRYLETLDDKQFRVEQQIVKERNDAANSAVNNIDKMYKKELQKMYIC